MSGYQVFAYTDLLKLERKVTEAIREGWEPWGSLVTTYDSGNGSYAPSIEYAQAMVKK